MADQSKELTTSLRDLCPHLENMSQMMSSACAILVVGSMIYEIESQNLREILGREPDDWDRFKYRAYFECARSVKEWQRQCNDDRKLREAAKQDAGLSG